MRCFFRVLAIFVFATFCNTVQCADNKTFPDGFFFGLATSAFQIEGGWNEDGKGESIWDRFIHNNPDIVQNGGNADVSCDSYHLWKKDIAALQHVGANVYRFSISWPRILPNGLSNNVSQAGIDYYNKLINGLLEAGIEPLVTLYHWDLPQKLQDLGGWTNPLIVDYFAEYARVAYANFGDRVKYWLTFNEPLGFCGGYTDARTPPDGVVIPGIGNYLCAHSVIKGHAKAYHIYDEEFKATQKGKVSITLNCDYIYPATDSLADIEAAERALQFRCGWYVHPLVHGNYPEVMIERIGNRSKSEGFTTSRLPTFSEEEQAYIKGTYDFIGLNSYGMKGAKDIDEPAIGEPSADSDMKSVFDDGQGYSGGLGGAFRAIINWISNNTNGADIMITENGLRTYIDGDFEDDDRIEYLQEHLIALLDTIQIDKINVFGYTAWTLMDNFEWTGGYYTKFGIYYVNYTDPARPRIAKKSAEWYKSVISTGDPYVNVTTLY